jgi:hypothetical protein
MNNLTGTLAVPRFLAALLDYLARIALIKKKRFDLQLVSG